MGCGGSKNNKLEEKAEGGLDPQPDLDGTALPRVFLDLVAENLRGLPGDESSGGEMLTRGVERSVLD